MEAKKDVNSKKHMPVLSMGSEQWRWVIFVVFLKASLKNPCTHLSTTPKLKQILLPTIFQPTNMPQPYYTFSTQYSIYQNQFLRYNNQLQHLYGRTRVACIAPLTTLQANIKAIHWPWNVKYPLIHTKVPHEPHNKTTTTHQPWVNIAYIPIGQTKVLDCA
jgi:hypothetical protein